MHRTMTILLFSKIFLIISLECEEIITGGDFNLVMDAQRNKKGGNATTHRNSLYEVQNIANSLDLIDGWRTLKPDGKRFYLAEN